MAVFKDAKKFREKQDELKRILQDKKVVNSLTPESSLFLKQLDWTGDTIAQEIKKINTVNIFNQKIIDTLLQKTKSLTEDISSFIDEQGRIVNQLKQLKLIP